MATMVFHGDDWTTSTSNASIHHAISFLVATLQSNWGKDLSSFLDTFDDDDDERDESLKLLWRENVDCIRNDFRKLFVQQGFGKNGDHWELKTAALQMTRAMTILVEHAVDDLAGCDDLRAALEAADRFCAQHHANGSSSSATAHILCFEIMCAGFLALREPQAAITSIRSQMEILLGHEEIRVALQTLSVTLDSSDKKVLYREQKALLDLLFSRVCAAVAVCERLYGHREEYHRAYFEHLLLQALDNEDLDDFPWMVEENWEDLRVFKMAFHETVAVTAVPGVALTLADPFIGVMAAVGSVPLFMRHARFLTKPLKVFDVQPNLYNLRKLIIRIGQGLPVFPKAIQNDEDEYGADNEARNEAFFKLTNGHLEIEPVASDEEIDEEVAKKAMSNENLVEQSQGEQVPEPIGTQNQVGPDLNDVAQESKKDTADVVQDQQENENDVAEQQPSIIHDKNEVKDTQGKKDDGEDFEYLDMDDYEELKTKK